MRYLTALMDYYDYSAQFILSMISLIVHLFDF